MNIFVSLVNRRFIKFSYFFFLNMWCSLNTFIIVTTLCTINLRKLCKTHKCTFPPSLTTHSPLSPSQEQLRHKQKFNLVTFNSRAHSWKDRLVEVTEKNLQGAWQWIKNLVCLGSTNTMAALRHALSDPSTQAIYLLTDGRPDQVLWSLLKRNPYQSTCTAIIAFGVSSWLGLRLHYDASINIVIMHPNSSHAEGH